jgi:integrase
MDGDRDARRRTGSVRQRGNSLQVRLFSGVDPVTGRDIYLTATVKGTDKAAQRAADDKLAEFRTRVVKQRSAQSSVSLGYALDEFMRNAELDDSTRHTYEGYIRRTIRPKLGEEPAKKIDARVLESFYSELRRCRALCDSKPRIDKHQKDGAHDCVAEKCKIHECKPMASSTIRQIHAIISGAFDASVRWGWIDANPARIARKPKQKHPEPDPPTADEAVRLSDEAFRMDKDVDDWGMLVWLAMTTGMRRGELVALRFKHLDLDGEVIDLRRNWVLGKEKDTKTHQNRRIALDTETIVLLKEHRDRVQKRVEALGVKFTDDLFVFTSLETSRGHVPDHTTPYSPNAITQRYKDMATRLGIETHLHALRHYSATELLTAGVDLPTVAGRLGHDGGGATTLRVYAAWVAASDRKAAEILGSRMPKRPPKPSAK